MASYSDEHYVDFWRPLARRFSGGSAAAQPNFCRLGSLTKNQEEDLRSWGVPKGLVRKALSQLCNVHGVKSVPEPVLAYAKDWSDEFTYGGWHTWNPGTRAHKVMGLLRAPLPGLHICGEAYSGEQGWIEGALKSTELAMLSLELPPPRWWTKDESGEELEQYCLS